LLNVATPEVFVVAEPTDVPLRVKVTILPLIPELFAVSVAERLYHSGLLVA